MSTPPQPPRRASGVAACVLVGALAGPGTVLASTLDYDFKPISIGGGGWVTGLVVHPTQPDVIYARTDVGGAYKWDARSQTWLQLATVDRLPDVTDYQSGTGVESMGLAPSDPMTMYMAYQDRVYRSTNGANSFTATDLNLPMEPNGRGFRMHGERLVVDPVNPDVALFGSQEDGLWMTINGTDWSQVSTAQLPVSASDGGVTVVKYDPASPVASGRTQGAYAAVAGRGIYHTHDAGASWNNLAEISGGPGAVDAPTDLEVRSDGTVYVTYGEGGESVWRYRDGAAWGGGGSDWQEITPRTNRDWMSVAIDPFSEDRIVTTSSGMKEFYVSKDGGGSWTKYERAQPSLSPQIPWLAQTTESWFSHGEIVFDPTVPDRMWVPQGLGVARADQLTGDLADDGEVTWTYYSRGIEEMVANDIIAPPGGKPVAAVWDRTAFVINDVDSYTAVQVLPEQFSSGWDVSYRPGDPGYITVVSTNHQDNENFSRYSTDGGQTWQPFGSLNTGTHPQNLNYGRIAAGKSGSNYANSLVWVSPWEPVPYFSLDGGDTWQPATGWFTDGSGDPVDHEHWSQYFNGEHLIASPWTEGTYFLHVAPSTWPDTGFLAKSSDGGQSWEKLFDGLPRTGLQSTLAATPDHEGHLWYAPGYANDDREDGLWRSLDGGALFEQVPGVDEAVEIAMGKAAPNSDYPTLFLLGKVGENEGLFRSIDEGSTWDFITRFPVGLTVEPNSLEGDWDTFGRVYLGMGGNSFVYGDVAVIPEPVAAGMLATLVCMIACRRRGR